MRTLKRECFTKKGHPGDIRVTALLATFGYASVPVVRKPVVGIIATGTELLNVSDPLEPGKSATAMRVWYMHK